VRLVSDDKKKKRKAASEKKKPGCVKEQKLRRPAMKILWK